jgi:nicotinate-nucleotide pyrophosphorylase (carboxylating)
VIAGRAWFDETFRQLDAAVLVRWNVDDGASVSAGREVCTLEGPARAILTGERTALNFLQTLSATATRAGRYVGAVRGTGVRVLDTRKTIPGLRVAQKYAVLCGGADNHRMGLFDAILIKENHIDAAGSITAAVQSARRLYPGLPLEVEVENAAQLDEAWQAGATRALLDNFSLDELQSAVHRHGGKITLEASGGIDLETIRPVAETGVDCISVGDMTKSIDAVDFSMRFS